MKNRLKLAFRLMNGVLNMYNNNNSNRLLRSDGKRSNGLAMAERQMRNLRRHRHS